VVEEVRGDTSVEPAEVSADLEVNSSIGHIGEPASAGVSIRPQLTGTNCKEVMPQHDPASSDNATDLHMEVPVVKEDTTSRPANNASMHANDDGDIGYVDDAFERITEDARKTTVKEMVQYPNVEPHSSVGFAPHPDAL